MTGDITRLSGQGSRELSVARHAPHVDAGEKSPNSVVTITGRLPDINGSVTIERSVKTSSKANVTPRDQAVIDAVTEIERHPEFALSRREIAKYIMTPAGQRAEDVQTLLRLGELDKIRKALTTVAHKEKSASGNAASESRRIRGEFLQGLGLTNPDLNSILSVVNKRRAVLKLSPLQALTNETVLTDGLVSTSVARIKPSLSKSVALSDIGAFTMLQPTQEPSLAVRTELANRLRNLSRDVNGFRALRQQRLVQAGFDLVDEDGCPLCDTPWEQDELRLHLQSKLKNAKDAESKINQIKGELEPLISAQNERRDALERFIEYANALKLNGTNKALTDAIDTCITAITKLTNSICDQASLDDSVALLVGKWMELPPELITRLQQLHGAVKALPDQSPEDEARDALLLDQERYAKAVARKSEANIAEARQLRAQAALDLFNSTTTAVLNQIYDTVAEDFSKYYRLLNKGDEDTFRGDLISEPAKLSLNVDFYGRGHFPPGAYHSEGHQDGMGLCLYLALMKHTLGSRFRFSVLDDVLMSVDASHRREVCRLLCSEFPDTQFVLTTHDRVWLQYMRTEGLIRHSESFGGWTIDMGPRIWMDLDIWKEIFNRTDRSSVPEAASILRRYLEYIARMICHGVRAPVRFRSDDRYELGDLLEPALSRILRFLRDARKAARSWGDEGLAGSIDCEIDAYKKAFQETQLTRWTINPSVHYNEWISLSPDEFRSVCDSYRALIDLTKCSSCQGFLYTIFHDGKPDVMKCNCGKRRYNLALKKA